MKKQISLFAFLVVLLGCLASCSMKEDLAKETNHVSVKGRDIPIDAFEQNHVRVLLTEEMADKLELDMDAQGMLMSSNTKSLNNSIASLGIKKMYRTFPYAGEYEERTRREGLHLWYDVYFEENTGLTKASEELSSIEGIAKVEYRPTVIRYTSTPIPETFISYEEAANMPVQTSDAIFNDPRLGQQWHYYNDGSLRSSVAGCDINVMPAWEKGIVGNESVIVSVVDGGIDYEHEDLAFNMWDNPDIPGTCGADFSRGSYNISYYITPDEHGTHVAGTIAAVNNNGVGVCGIAGGNYAVGIRGVQLMSCQIFSDSETSGSDGPAAIKWGADNGAVISQNSWGYDPTKIHYTPDSDKDAIDYFIKYAGMDAMGQFQVGPMAGGVVIFAAGNDGVDEGYPASYESCIAVTAIGPDFEDAYYTCYGDWCDIIAPGGDDYKQNVLSTVPGGYQGYQGTSMACPHVSGVAALLVSRFGGKGFTCDDLKNLMFSSLSDISMYMAPNKYFGQGLINVGKAVAGDSKIAPDPITDLSATANSNNVTFTFTVPNDEDDGSPAQANIYYSTESFDVTAETLPSHVKTFAFQFNGLFAGMTATGTITGLEFNTKYYLSADVRDWSPNYSARTELIEVTTTGNTPPTISPISDTHLELKSYETKTLDFNLSDADGHKVTVHMTEDYPGVSVGNINETVARLSISAAGLESGDYTAIIVAEDEFGGTSELEITYVISANQPPVQIKDFADIVFDSPEAETLKITLSQYFKDEDNEPIIYRVEVKDAQGNNSTDIIRGSLNSGIYNITPLAPGSVNITFYAKDASGVEIMSNTFKVMVRARDLTLEIYPNPVIDVLNLRTGEEMSVSLTVENSNGVVAFTKEGVITPFEPMQIRDELASLPAGQYKLKAVLTSQRGVTEEVVENFIKL